jgi:hypothetical protein
MPLTTSKQVSRSTEILVTENYEEGSIMGYWKATKFHQLRKGDIFRLWDTNDEGYRTPDRVNPATGEHDVCVALTDAEYKKDEETFDKDLDPTRWGVQCVAIRGVCHGTT